MSESYNICYFSNPDVLLDTYNNELKELYLFLALLDKD